MSCIRCRQPQRSILVFGVVSLKGQRKLHKRSNVQQQSGMNVPVLQVKSAASVIPLLSLLGGPLIALSVQPLIRSRNTPHNSSHPQAQEENA